MAICIDKELCKQINSFANKTWPQKRVKWMCKPGSWQRSRYIQISTPLKDMDLHYELYCGKVQLHIEGKFKKEKYKPFINYLRKEVKSDDHIKWRRWMGMAQGLCEINYEINDLEDAIQYLTDIINLFDPIIQKYTKAHQSEQTLNIEEELSPLQKKLKKIITTILSQKSSLLRRLILAHCQSLHISVHINGHQGMLTS